MQGSKAVVRKVRQTIIVIGPGCPANAVTTHDQERGDDPRRIGVVLPKAPVSFHVGGCQRSFDRGIEVASELGSDTTSEVHGYNEVNSMFFLQPEQVCGISHYLLDRQFSDRAMWPGILKVGLRRAGNHQPGSDQAP